jgi:hypothetical protein
METSCGSTKNLKTSMDSGKQSNLQLESLSIASILHVDTNSTTSYNQTASQRRASGAAHLAAARSSAASSGRHSSMTGDAGREDTSGASRSETLRTPTQCVIVHMRPLRAQRRWPVLRCTRESRLSALPREEGTLA